MPSLIMLVGPPGSGKSTFARNWMDNEPASSNMAKKIRISQDDQGKDHLKFFKDAISHNNGTYDVIVDRMNFNREQRERYLNPAKDAGYDTKIIVLHENRDTCMKRCIARANFHPNITNEKFANNALDTFFKLYERPHEGEADVVTFVYPTPTLKPSAIIIDIDGTAANIDHRLHFVRQEGKKKDWKSFFDNIHLDTPNAWCKDIVNSMAEKNIIVFCSGRPDSLRKTTQEWLDKYGFKNDWLLMRPRADHREDSIVKEIILDFEVKTRFSNVKFAIDDRKRVVDLWRSRGITCLQCAPGDF